MNTFNLLKSSGPGFIDLLTAKLSKASHHLSHQLNNNYNFVRSLADKLESLHKQAHYDELSQR